MDAKGKQLPDPDSLEPVSEDPVIAWATIIKSKTEDEMFEVDEKYRDTRIAVNLRTTTYGMLYNNKHKKYHRREIIFKVDSPDEWIPTELLDIDI